MAAIRPMTAMQEQRLARRIADRDLVARDRLAMAWLPLARRLARRYEARGHEKADLVSEATVGLFRAATEYRPGLGRFRPVAVRAILRSFWRVAKAARRERGRRVAMTDAAECVRASAESGRVVALREAMEAVLSPRERAAVRATSGIDATRRKARGGRESLLVAGARIKLRKAIEEREERR